MTSDKTISSDYQKALNLLKPFCKKDFSKANLQLIFTFAMLHGLIICSFFLYLISPYISLAISPLIMVFMSKSFVIMHDCGHQSFYHKKRLNTLIGNIMAFPIAMSYSMWKFIHDSHHKHVGNLDKRSVNPEMWTMTKSEFDKASAFKKITYRFIRSKFCQFLISPFAVFFIIFRFPNSKFNLVSNLSVIIYDFIYLWLFWVLIQNFGFQQLLFVYLIPLFLFANLASYVFYAQHQYEDTYWENDDVWSYGEATFKGSTYLTAPKWFNWMSGNVVYHNIHHLISAIPNYNLEKANLVLSQHLTFKPISLFKVYGLVNLKLWDENKKKMVGFKEEVK